MPYILEVQRFDTDGHIIHPEWNGKKEHVMECFSSNNTDELKHMFVNHSFIFKIFFLQLLENMSFLIFNYFPRFRSF